jgi:hypothetical protein
MSLSQEERQKFEEDFKYLVGRYVEFFTQYNQLLNKSERSKEEEQEFLAVQKMLLNIGEALSTALQTLGDDLFGKAVDLYYYYKDMAASGNKEVQGLLNELKPLFAASLQARINKN